MLTTPKLSEASGASKAIYQMAKVHCYLGKMGWSMESHWTEWKCPIFSHNLQKYRWEKLFISLDSLRPFLCWQKCQQWSIISLLLALFPLQWPWISPVPQLKPANQNGNWFSSTIWQQTCTFNFIFHAISGYYDSHQKPWDMRRENLIHREEITTLNHAYKYHLGGAVLEKVDWKGLARVLKTPR